MPLLFPEDKEYFLNLPASKSILNRILILNSITRNDLIISPASQCNDVIEMLKALMPLGINYHYKNPADHDSDLVISWDNPITNHAKIIIEEAGTVLRFILSRYAFQEGFSIIIELGAPLLKRPIIELINSLKELGADINLQDNLIIIKGKKLSGKKITLNGNISSQFISSLVLCSSLLSSPLEINIKEEILSLSYIDMTINLLNSLNINVIRKNHLIFCPNLIPVFSEKTYTCEIDYSSAAYLWTYGLLSNQKIYIESQKNDSLQGDYKLIDILCQIGANLSSRSLNNKECLSFAYSHQIKGLNLSMKSMPDQVLTFALLALFADRETHIRDIEHLRYKESDRIDNLITEFRKLGVQISYNNNLLTIYPLKQRNKNIILCTHNDHRFAMIFVILQKLYPDILIDSIDCIKKSAPEFIDLIK